MTKDDIVKFFTDNANKRLTVTNPELKCRYLIYKPTMPLKVEAFGGGYSVEGGEFVYQTLVETIERKATSIYLRSDWSLDWFVPDGKQKSKSECTCPSFELACFGCKCGAFQREMEVKRG